MSKNKGQHDFIDALPNLFWVALGIIALLVCLLFDINIVVLIGVVIFACVGFLKELTGGNGFK